jgi:hypothetical protein
LQRSQRRLPSRGYWRQRRIVVHSVLMPAALSLRAFSFQRLVPGLAVEPLGASEPDLDKGKKAPRIFSNFVFAFFENTDRTFAVSCIFRFELVIF